MTTNSDPLSSIEDQLRGMGNVPLAVLVLTTSLLMNLPVVALLYYFDVRMGGWQTWPVPFVIFGINALLVVLDIVGVIE